MKEILVSTALALGQTPSVVDGDTVKLAGISIRLTDFDTPELHAASCRRS
jgi:endonuclease YncB( thermonuclease family)